MEAPLLGSAARPRGTARRAGRCSAAAALGLGLALAFRGAAVAEPANELSPPQVRAWQTGLLRPDRMLHAGFALSIGLSAGIATRKPAAALGGAMALGLAKELWDGRRRRFDVLDLCADLVGAGIASEVTDVIRR